MSQLENREAAQIDETELPLEDKKAAAVMPTP